MTWSNDPGKQEWAERKGEWPGREWGEGGCARGKDRQQGQSYSQAVKLVSWPEPELESEPELSAMAGGGGSGRGLRRRPRYSIMSGW